MASLKTEVDKSDIDNLVPIPVDLSKLSDVVKNDVVKKTEYNKLVTKVNGIDTTNFVSKTKYERDRSDFEEKISKVEEKIPDVSSLAKKTDFNAKISEVEGKIPSISGLATNLKLNTVENKTSDVSSLIKKTVILKRKLLIMIMANTLLLQNFNTMTARLAVQTDLIRKPEFDAKLKGICERVT